MLTKEQILSVRDVEITKHTVNAWGGDIYLSTFSVGQYEEFSKIVAESASVASLLAIAIVDENGKRLFIDEKDVEALANKNLKVANDIINKWLSINSISKDSVEKAEKN